MNLPTTWPLTCIVADDVAVMREVVRVQLSLLPWIEVIGEADDGPAALDLADRLRPDVAILDVRMPRLSGFAVVEHLLQRGVATRVVLFSAFACDENVAWARELGADYVSKVDGFDGMFAALERLRALALFEECA